jgi:AraC-like DNA-binding protein
MQMAVLNHPENADVLTDVLKNLKLRGRVFCCSELSAPWAMSLPTSDYAHFHVIERGGAWLRMANEKHAHPLASGDLVIIPHGRGHVLSDQPDTKPVPLRQLIKGRTDSCNLMQHGGGGAQTLMTCGSFQFESAGPNPLLAVLPPLIHLHGNGGRSVEWLEATLRMLADEARQPRAGAETLIARLLDIIFVQALRVWVESQPLTQGGWLGALRDQQIGTALSLIHREPHRSWSVQALASEVAMSRSPFAARFTEMVGEPPLTYLTSWRMHLAETMLIREGLNVGEVARKIGYESEAAFSKAFKRYFGQSPLTHRRQTQLASATKALRAASAN